MASVTDVSTNVIVSDVSSSRMPLDQLERATFIAPVTVAMILCLYRATLEMCLCWL